MFGSRENVGEFPEGLCWKNSEPLSFAKELRGKIVLLDFWCFCCINCMHVLPELRYLEQKYAKDPVVIIGVHSPKFAAEKEWKNVEKAIERYQIHHPVVHDPNLELWQRFQIQAWPSFVLINPEGKWTATYSGEGRREEMDRQIASLLVANPMPEALSPLPKRTTKTPSTQTYSFPGKLAIDPLREHLCISDSNHHRLVLTDFSGNQLEEIGSGRLGMIDGSFKEACFHRPQGVVWCGDKLYVADTENHLIRCCDFVNKEVTTLAGTGQQGRDLLGGGLGRDQPLSSPWDLVVDKERDLLWIAMAGTHQIWTLDLATNMATVFAGTGLEAHLNHTQPLLAAFAQPSGLTLGQSALFIADSEASAIRKLDLDSGAVTTVAGADPSQPYNLFLFGDQEGRGSEARFQHPLGVLYWEERQKLLVADTYNHKIMLVDPKTGEVKHFLPQDETLSFWEPSGLALTGSTLFVADTNHHLIRKIDLERLPL